TKKHRSASMRTTYCGLVSEALMGQTVTLMGWAHRRRDHGGVIFIELRDREGHVQIVCDPDRPEMFKTAEGVRNEFCLKVAGLDRYYQITKCFRDEDLRADRQPEFTQIDIETSFLNEEEIRGMFEGMIRTVFRNTIGVDLPGYPVMTYADAMHQFGSDK